MYLEVTTLEPIVARVLSEISVGRAVTDVSLRNEVPAELAATADAERINQVLYNLVDNAVRFTPPGGSVAVLATRQDDRVVVEVRDSGVGIASEHLPRLFERFYRADASRSREGGGTGIGLAIARSIVESHGGRITATSEPGHGSAFTFDLPAAEAAVSTTDRRAST